MSLTSIETKHIINKGFKPENINSPFINTMWEKNKFKLGNHITSIGAAFYIVPFINAMVRSGTQEEKTLLFESMLEWKANEMVVTDKRGIKGQLVPKVEQAVLVVGRVKTRQTKAQDLGMDLLEKMIINDNMLNHKVLLFLLNPGEIDRNIAGLVANKIMAKYQRPVCILTKCIENNETSYQGSARGYSKSGVTDFKAICESTEKIMYASGHSNAFGLGILANNINDFIIQTDELLKNMTDEAIYYVDYIFNHETIDKNIILTIGGMSDLWGQDVDEPKIVIEDLALTSDMITIYRKTNNTLKIHLSNNIDIMLFNADETFCQLLENNMGVIKINLVGTCNINEWNGNITPQIFIEDYEITGTQKWIF